ncbi:hypothetical protein BO71DRAFT_348221 [Aspergillus ellipticus CBS 707.79]|uniref:Protein kinase domain-containing protein n=1 Tax=Aspergillus ellipticus CBS 707.79 TaxID=1448320 RepID=A0A319EYF5_9EURO|nr:hypothetical protein BO71DRAFT_348221 [Aspergillus ellipticus CBS 707.79]
MGPQGDCSLDLDPRDIVIEREISRSEASTVFEVRICGKTRVMKLYHDNGDPGYSKRGRDLNRFRCELNAYRNLLKFGVCGSGFVPFFHGFINRLDPSDFGQQLNHFRKDKFFPRAIVLEYLPVAEKLNCVNYSDELFYYALEGIKEIHRALIHHHDIYPKNMLVVSCSRIIWVDFDVAMTFKDIGIREKAYCEYEVGLVKSFGKKLKNDKLRGLPPNTTYY